MESENYLKERETGWGRDCRAYLRMREVWADLPPGAAAREKDALARLKIRHSYVEIERAVEWLRVHGDPRDRSRCLYPLSWLAARPGRLDLVAEKIRRDEIRAARAERYREMISEREAEARRAAEQTERGLQLFEREYPTEPDRVRAKMRVFNLFPAMFSGMEFTDPAAQSLMLAILVNEIESLSRFDQDERSQAA